MMQIIGTVLTIIKFLFKLNSESNKKKAKEKAELGKELIDALAETNKARRASYLNNVVVKLRK